MYKERLRYGEVLDKIDQHTVMCEVLGYQQIGSFFCNPLRRDRRPGCKIEWYGSRLVISDFAWEHNGSDCIKLWSLKYGVPINQALEEVYAKYVRSNIKPSNLNQVNQVSSVSQIKKETHLVPFERAWTDRDQEYWEGKYGFSKQELLEIGKYSGRFYPISSYEIETRFGVILVEPVDIAYAWTFPSGHHKIYRPCGNVLNKWISNVDSDNSDDLFFVRDFRSNVCVLGSSWKDCAVLYRDLPDVSFRAFQNEGIVGSNNIWNWVEHFDKIIISLDPDKAGQTATEKYLQKIKSHNVECSPFFLKEEDLDWADLWESNIDLYNEELFHIKQLLLF